MIDGVTLPDGTLNSIGGSSTSHVSTPTVFAALDPLIVQQALKATYWTLTHLEGTAKGQATYAAIEPDILAAAPGISTLQQLEQFLIAEILQHARLPWYATLMLPLLLQIATGQHLA